MTTDHPSRSGSYMAIYSAGSNAKGQLAHGTEDDSHRFRRCIFEGMESDPLASGIKSACMAFGANHTLLLLVHQDDSSSLWGCGDGSKGQLGDEFRRNAESCSSFRRIDVPKARDYSYARIAASWETSYVCLSHPDRSDILMSMGANDYGDRGTGSTPEEPYSAVSFDHLCNDEADSGRLRIDDIRAGPHNVLVQLSRLRKDGTLVTFTAGWGIVRHGQLGVASKSPFAGCPCRVPVANPSSFALGNQHSVFLSTSGAVTSLGSNKKRQRELHTAEGSVQSIGATWNGTYITERLDVRKWIIFATGSNAHAQLGCEPSQPFSRDIKLPEGSTVGNLACGSEHVLVLLDQTNGEHDSERNSASILGWGWNEHGNLALGHTNDVFEPTTIWPCHDIPPTFTNAVGIWAGCGTSWIAVTGKEYK